MKVSYVLVGSLFVLFLFFAIYGIVIFELSIDEIRKLHSTRNEAVAFNMMQDLNHRIENRISDLRSITKLSEIQNSLQNSNHEFQKIKNLKIFLDEREVQIEFDRESLPSDVIDIQLSKRLRDIILFYNEEYNSEVIKELLVTNAYGSVVAIGAGTSDYLQDDEEWWLNAKNKGIHTGSLMYYNDYDSFAIDFGFKILDANGNFLGVLRTVVSVEYILASFIDEADLVSKNQNRNVLLIDNSGIIIHSHNKPEIQTLISYFKEIQLGSDTGSIQITKPGSDINLVSFAKSTGYKTFEGFDWSVIVEQTRSSFVEEFVDLRNAILTTSVIGLGISIILALVISHLVTKPLKNLAKTANLISAGKFEVKATRSKLSELQTIERAFEEMISSLKRLISTEKKLAEVNTRVKYERLSAIGELAASLAHDLKNPLGTIKSSAEILRRTKKEKDPEIEQVLARMDRAVERMSHQIEDVLNYVRTTPVNLERVNLDTILSSALESIKIPNNITIKLPKNSVYLKCDKKKMEIVFINLILNSVQAIGKKSGMITISANEDKSSVQIQIEDSGMGIPEYIIEKIFEPLVTSKEKGTGLGLSTCKNIVEQHGGSISVKNNPTVFTITLPRD